MDPSLLLYVGRLLVYRSINNRRNPWLRASLMAMLACLRRCSQSESWVEPQTTAGGKVHPTVSRGTAASLVCVLLVLIMMSPVVAANGPTALICTDKAFYFYGDKFETSVSGWNFGEDMKVDVYVGLFTKFGTVYILQPDGTWSTSVKPCIKNMLTISPSELYNIPFISYSALPPTIPEGRYAIGIVLTKMGSFSWICDLNVVSFYIAKPIKLECYVNGTIGLDTNPGTNAEPWKTITYALSQVNQVSWSQAVVIHVANGTYASSVNGETFPLNLKPFVYLRGDNAQTTILDAEAKPHVIFCSKTEVRGQPFSIVEGFTIKGGFANGSPYTPDGCGGGVYCPTGYTLVLQKDIIKENVAAQGAGMYFTGSSPILHNNIVQWNEAYQDGGGILAENSSWASLIGNTVRENKAGFGAGINCRKSSPEIRNNFLISNVAEDLTGAIVCSGGAIHCNNSSPFIAGNMIKNNTANAVGDVGGQGGGIFCYEGSHPDVRSNAILSNKAIGFKSKGGGIACMQGASPKLLNSVIRGNVADGSTTGEGVGGGLYCQFSQMKVEECTFALNEATTSGGGIFNQCGSATFFNNLICENSALQADGGGICCRGKDISQILNCTIATNSASNGRGGGVYAVDISESGFTTIIDCILHGNVAPVGNQLYGKYTNVTYNCIQGWILGGTGNISADPKFVTGPFSKFYLDYTASPCINNGSAAAKFKMLDKQTTDAKGNPDAGQVDMGRHYLIP